MNAETIDDRVLRFLKRELCKEGAYLLPLRLFIGLGWLRAFAEKVADPDWLGGVALAAFLQETARTRRSSWSRAVRPRPSPVIETRCSVFSCNVASAWR